jgi:hypothetical protein
MKIPERWRKELKRLSGFHPSDRVLERARLGPVSSVREPSSAPPMVVIVVAFAVFASAGVLMWRAFTPGGGPATVWEPGYPSPPASGYYILFPDQAERSQAQGEAFRVRVTALTNLPDGTLLDITTTDEGTCCIPVKDSKIRFTTQDGACYGLIGQHPEGSTFDVTITAKPSFEPWIIPGPGPSPKAPQQPDSVVDVLGRDFDNLSGDQTQTQRDGSKWLVATSTVPWPQPRCGEDPIPLFGGEVCDPNQFQQQLQGDDLAGVMDEIVGTISQGRMCEFWSVMLPVGVRNCDHGLDLRIRCGRRRRPLPLRMPGKRVFCHSIRLPWRRNCLDRAGAEPFRAGLEPLGLRSHGLRVGGRYLIQALEEGDSHNLTAASSSEATGHQGDRSF